ncbi:MAG: M13 family metallopeptidase, partial [Ileibacterium sp.]|nr:M13 family metallopeptidase [Ileibacterium sp.]
MAGGIDKNLQVSPKDDYFSAINKDWIINTKVTENKPNKIGWDEGIKRCDQRLESIVRGKVHENTGTHPVGLSKEQADHANDLVVKMGKFAGSWDKRNELGAEPLRPYIDEIAKIKTLEEMDHYLTSKDAKKLHAFSLLGVGVHPTTLDKNTNYINILGLNQDGAISAKTTLSSYSQYQKLDGDGLMAVGKAKESMSSVLGRLGYSSADINKLTTQAFDLEAKLSEIQMQSEDASQKTEEAQMISTENNCTWEELKQKQGRYPLDQMLTGYGFNQTDNINLDYPKAVEAIGKLYSEQNLEKIKSYLILRTVAQGSELLDRNLYDSQKQATDTGSEDKPVNTSNWDDETKILMKDFIYKYALEPLNQSYIYQYCNEEKKAMVNNLINDIRQTYKEMLQKEDWLSEDAKQKASEKLDHITAHTLYPEKFTDFSKLSFDGAQNLVDAVAAVNNFYTQQAGEKAGSSVNKTDWHLNTIGTAEVNAFYEPNSNSIYITDAITDTLAGENPEKEKLMATLGTVVGHEISHGFDTFGSLYDKDGEPVDMFTPEDRAMLQLRGDRVGYYFDNLNFLPGSDFYDGQNVKDELIADMGGCRCMLNLAKKTENFDYVKFFEAYADLWKQKAGYEKLMNQAYMDNHPLNYFRVNSVLQQMPEFYETYGITEKDGMYL